MMRGSGHNKHGRGHSGRGVKFTQSELKKPSLSTVLKQASTTDSQAVAELFYAEFMQLFYQSVAIEYTEIAMIVKGHPVPPIPQNPAFLNGNTAAAKMHNEQAKAMIKILTEKREARPRMLEALKAKFMSRNDYSFASFMDNKLERQQALLANDWPTIMALHKQWYLERISIASSNPGVVDLEDQDKIKEEWRRFHQSNTMTVDNFAAQFKIMVGMIETRGGLVLTERQKAKAFVDKLNREKFKAWQEQVASDESRQREHMASGGQARLLGIGLPQTLENAIDRAKVKEQQLVSTPAKNKRERSKEDVRSSFAAVQHDHRGKKHRKESKASGGQREDNVTDNNKAKRVPLTRDQFPIHGC